jgi:hypothetical protein
VDSNFRFRTSREHFLCALEPGPASRPGSQSRILTTDNAKVIVRRARLAPAMISTPGHRVSRRRQREAPPAWRDFSWKAATNCDRSNPGRGMPHQAKDEGVARNTHSRPRKQRMVSTFVEAHRCQEPKVRIHLPPAKSLRTIGSAAWETTRARVRFRGAGCQVCFGS